MINVDQLLSLMKRIDGSDLFVTEGVPASIKVKGAIRAVDNKRLDQDDTRKFAYSIMDDEQRKTFEQTKECNFAIHLNKLGRFRVNVFLQRGSVGVVLRKINTKIPNLAELAQSMHSNMPIQRIVCA